MVIAAVDDQRVAVVRYSLGFINYQAILHVGVSGGKDRDSRGYRRYSRMVSVLAIQFCPWPACRWRPGSRQTQ